MHLARYEGDVDPAQEDKPKEIKPQCVLSSGRIEAQFRVNNWRRKMEKFIRIANKALGPMIKRRVESAAKRRQEFWNILYSCVANCYEHNDVSWVNRGLEMAKAVGRYRATLAILKQVTPFKYDTATQQFGGKRKVNMFEKLENKYGEVLLALVTQQVEADSKPRDKKDYEFEKALDTFLKRAAKHDIDDAEVIEAIRNRAKEKAAA